MAKSLKNTIKHIVSEGAEKVLKNIILKEAMEVQKTERAYDKVLSKVNTQFGAPMGRHSDYVRDKPTDQKVYDAAVPLNQGYDRGGAYWGAPNDLRVEYTKDLSYVRFYRTGDKNNSIAESKNIKLTKEQFKEYVLSEAKRLSEDNESPVLEIKRVQNGLFIKNITPDIPVDARDLIWALADNDMSTDSYETGWLKVIDRNIDVVYGVDDYSFNKLDDLNKEGEVILPIENLKPSDFPEENDFTASNKD